MRDVIPTTRSREETRSRIIDVAAQLLQDHGPGAVTTRGVAQGAGVQAPVIYRLFGDKNGLLDAIAEHVLAAYVDAKSDKAAAAALVDGDPVTDLRTGWEMHVEFGLANPTLFTLLNDPAREKQSPAVATGMDVLRSRIRRMAAAGLLRVSEKKAVELIHAGGTGAVLTLLAMPPEARDPDLATDIFEALLRTILPDVPIPVADDAVAAAVTFRTVIPRLPALSDAERSLMAEWIDRATTRPNQAPKG